MQPKTGKSRNQKRIKLTFHPRCTALNPPSGVSQQKLLSFLGGAGWGGVLQAIVSRQQPTRQKESPAGAVLGILIGQNSN